MGHSRPVVKWIRSISCLFHFSELCTCAGTVIARILARMDYDTLRIRLAARKGQWTEIGAHAGVDRRTIYRLLHEPGYNPTHKTMRNLSLALRAVRAPRVSEPA